MVMVDKSSMMELRESPIAGIDVNEEENLDRKHTMQMMAQLITYGKGINLEDVKDSSMSLLSWHTPFRRTVPLGQLPTQVPL